MNIGLVGSGEVALALGTKLLELGHEVMISSRDISMEKDRGVRGKIPSVNAFCNTHSLGERIQEALPATKVVKTLNAVNADVMVNPSLIAGDHDLFMAGNDAEAKRWVKDTFLMEWFGWKSVVDLGDITAARAMEMYLLLWLRLWGVLQTPNFNVKVVK